jgi:predicted transcriptional regulator
MDPLKIYTANAKTIESIYRSRLKIQILLALHAEPATLGKLRSITGSTSQAIIPKIRRLEAQLLIESLGYEYVLTPLGRVVASRMLDFIRVIGTINRHREFWATHDLNGIPPEFLASIDSLLDSELVYDTPEDVVHIYTLFLEIVKDASHIYGVSSVMSPGFADALTERIQAGIPVELVVNRETITRLSLDPYILRFTAALAYPNFKVWVTEDPIRIGLTVTDRCISLGFFKKDSIVYDSSSDLYSTDPEAIAWGTRLFRYLRTHSTPLDLETLR